MKKLVTLLIISSLYAPLHCMEEENMGTSSSSSAYAAAFHDVPSTLPSDNDKTAQDTIPSLKQLCIYTIAKKNLLPKKINDLEKLPLECIQATIKECIMQKNLIDEKPIKTLTNPDDRCIISGSNDNAIRIWYMKPCTQLVTHDDWHFSTHPGKNVLIWKPRLQPNTRLYVLLLIGHTCDITSICIIETQDGRRILSGSEDGTIHIWDTLDIFDKLNTIDYAQAADILKALDTTTDEAVSLQKIKSILNPSNKFFNTTNVTALGILGAVAGYALYRFATK